MIIDRSARQSCLGRLPKGCLVEWHRSPRSAAARAKRCGVEATDHDVATKRSQEDAWEATVAVVRDGSVLINCAASVVVHPATDDHQEPRRCRPDGQAQGRAVAAEEVMTPAAGESAKSSSLFTTVGPSHRTGQSCIGLPVTWWSAWKSASDSRLRT